MKRSIRLVFGGVVALFLCAGTAQALTGVITGPSDVAYPAFGVDPTTGDRYLAFTQAPQGGHPNAWYRRNGGSKVRLNTRGIGWTFGLDPAITTITYQQAVRNTSRIKLFDWSTKTRRDAGALVNVAGRWQYSGSISGPWLSFARLNSTASPDVRKLYLYNTDTQERRLLDTFIGPLRAGVIQNGQVNGDWEVWSKMRDGYRKLSVFRYQISTGRTTQVPRALDRYDYGPSVTPGGTMYFIRSRFACGRGVTLRSFDPLGTMRTVFSFPSGRSVDDTFAVANQDGSTTIYYDSYRCADDSANGNIYKLTIPAAGGAVSAPVRVGHVTSSASGRSSSANSSELGPR